MTLRPKGDRQGLLQPENRGEISSTCWWPSRCHTKIERSKTPHQARVKKLESSPILALREDMVTSALYIEGFLAKLSSRFGNEGGQTHGKGRLFFSKMFATRKRSGKIRLSNTFLTTHCREKSGEGLYSLPLID